ncbi:MAG: cbb3-type cytochrome c oxidase subunit 3 [Deltaproteobacteria bacterium]|nr:cbb3-type cytochrome c oxidase subunit 3 [Deltaproteobacteria bacterium]
MSIGDLVSKLTPSDGAQVGVVLFAGVFVALVIRLWSRGQREAIATSANLPLADDDLPGGHS